MRRRLLGITAISLGLCSGPVNAQHLDFSDAEVLALEISGALVAPADMVEQINLDLAAIRMLNPVFESIHAIPDWVPGELLVVLTPAAWDSYQQGAYTGLDALNQQYGPVHVSAPYSTLPILYLLFAAPYHPMHLSDLYAQADGVEAAEPNSIFNATGHDIRSNAVGTYTFVLGWGDFCVPMCPFEHSWTFAVEEGRVTLLDEGGHPLAVQAQTWSQIKARYR